MTRCALTKLSLYDINSIKALFGCSQIHPNSHGLGRIEALFGCYRIYLNSYALGWIRAELTKFHLNPHQPLWIGVNTTTSKQGLRWNLG
jgi:hypothetical protein